MKDYRLKLGENQEIKIKIARAVGKAENMIKESKGNIFSLSDKRNNLKEEIRRVDQELR